jgi:hypothetical protein
MHFGEVSASPVTSSRRRPNVLGLCPMWRLLNPSDKLHSHWIVSNAHMYTCTSARMHACTYARLHACTYARLHGSPEAHSHTVPEEHRFTNPMRPRAIEAETAANGHPNGSYIKSSFALSLAEGRPKAPQIVRRTQSPSISSWTRRVPRLLQAFRITPSST